MAEVDLNGDGLSRLEIDAIPVLVSAVEIVVGSRLDRGRSATGVVFGNRASGGRVLGFELHGVGIGCYARIPQLLEVHEDNEVTIVNGWEVDGVDEGDVHEYEGTLTAHRHFVECVRERNVPLTDLRDVVKTGDLVDRIEGERD